MGEVYLDGEKVDFQGAEPRAAGEVWNLIVGYLSDRGRSVAVVELDGQKVSPEEIDSEGGYRRLAFTSQSAVEQLLGMCERWVGECEEVARRAKSLAGAVLRKNWTEGQAETVEFVEGLRPLIEGMGVAQGYGNQSEAAWTATFSGAFESSVQAIDKVADAIQARNVVALSDALAERLAVRWAELGGALEQAVIPRLTEEGSR